MELGAGFHPDLTGRENIYMNGAILGLDQAYLRKKFDEIVAFSELESFIDVPVKYYSSGMYVRLGISVAVHTEPEILLIDEVLAVGDANFQHKCLGRISELRRTGVTIVFVSHGLDAIQNLCDEAFWFDDGRVAFQGSATDTIMEYLNSVARQEELTVSRLRANGESKELISSDRRWGTGEHEYAVLTRGTPGSLRWAWRLTANASGGSDGWPTNAPTRTTTALGNSPPTLATRRVR